MAREQKKIAKRLRSLISSSDALDPVKTEAEKEVLSFLKKELSENPKMLEAARQGKRLSVELTGESSAELNQDDLRRLFSQALQELKEREDEA